MTNNAIVLRKSYNAPQRRWTWYFKVHFHTPWVFINRPPMAVRTLNGTCTDTFILRYCGQHQYENSWSAMNYWQSRSATKHRSLRQRYCGSSSRVDLQFASE